MESVGDDTEHMSNYYGKSPASMSSQSSGWQEQPMDPGTLCGVVQHAASVRVTKVFFLNFQTLICHQINKIFERKIVNIFLPISFNICYLLIRKYSQFYTNKVTSVSNLRTFFTTCVLGLLARGMNVVILN